MKESLDKVRKALSRQDIVASMTQYLVRDGTITAGDGRYTACAPIPCDGTFAVPGREFERLINRLPSIESVQIGDGSITLRSRRMHGTIKTLPANDVEYAQPGDTWNPLPPNFLTALALIRPFISDNAIHPWALCACIGRDSFVATTNVSLAQVDCPSLDGAGHLLPCWAVDYLLSRKDGNLIGWQLYPNYAAFKWDDNSWMRTQLINDEFPTTGLKLFENYKKPEWAITNEWREAYEFVSEMTESVVEVHATKLVGHRDASEVEHEIPLTPVPVEERSLWASQFLDAVIKNATHWEPDKYPNPTAFAAPGLRGFIIGRR
jgi:hypothetical protein